MRGRLLIALLALSFLVFCLPGPVLAQAQVEQPTVDFVFGERLTFTARLQADVSPQEVVIFIKDAGESNTDIRPVEIQPLEGTSFLLVYHHNLKDLPFRGFARIKYRFQVKFVNGGNFTSDFFDFYYLDNRFTWQNLEEKPFRVHWVEGDVNFGQDILDTAQIGLQQVKSLVQGSAPEWLDIYAYPNARQMQTTLNSDSQSWVAGHADPDLGVMVVSLPAGAEQRLLMEQRIPHELMHIMLYQVFGAAYVNLPAWLSEGLASIAESYPNPDYQVLLESAYQKGTLLPISGLCQSFPRDANNAGLAYAEAASFTRYLHLNFGASGLQALVTFYANGLDCNRGAEAGLNQSLARLESRWRRDTFSELAYLTFFNKLLPWLVLLIAVLAAPLILTLTRRRGRSSEQLVDPSLGH